MRGLAGGADGGRRSGATRQRPARRAAARASQPELGRRSTGRAHRSLLLLVRLGLLREATQGGPRPTVVAVTSLARLSFGRLREERRRGREYSPQSRSEPCLTTGQPSPRTLVALCPPLPLALTNTASVGASQATRRRGVHRQAAVTRRVAAVTDALAAEHAPVHVDVPDEPAPRDDAGRRRRRVGLAAPRLRGKHVGDRRGQRAGWPPRRGTLPTPHASTPASSAPLGYTR